jgi:chromosomal replication initiation ATPase DnaA
MSADALQHAVHVARWGKFQGRSDNTAEKAGGQEERLDALEQALATLVRYWGLPVKYTKLPSGAVLQHNLQRRRPTIKEIQLHICKVHNVSYAELIGSSREQRIVWARHIAIYLARRLTGHSLPVIGRHFGERDHSTIKYAVDAMENARALHTDLTELEDALTAQVPQG